MYDALKICTVFVPCSNFFQQRIDESVICSNDKSMPRNGLWFERTAHCRLDLITLAWSVELASSDFGQYQLLLSQFPLISFLFSRPNCCWNVHIKSACAYAFFCIHVFPRSDESSDFSVVSLDDTRVAMEKGEKEKGSNVFWPRWNFRNNEESAESDSSIDRWSCAVALFFAGTFSETRNWGEGESENFSLNVFYPDIIVRGGNKREVVR